MTDNVPTLDSQSLYINRELSWIRFNHHVLEEAQDKRHPLLERVKFLSIFANNLDEFFMIRVSGLQRQAAKGVLKAPPDGMTASEQILAIEKALLPELDLQYDCWNKEILPRLAAAGIFIHQYSESGCGAEKGVAHLFYRRGFPRPHAARFRFRPPVSLHFQSFAQPRHNRPRPG